MYHLCADPPDRGPAVRDQGWDPDVCRMETNKVQYPIYILELRRELMARVLCKSETLFIVIKKPTAIKMFYWSPSC